MLTKNKYLKEIGIDPDKFWLFDEGRKKTDIRYQIDEDGFIPAEFFNLDATLIATIYCHLRYFQEHCIDKSYPMSFTVKYGLDKGREKWNEMIDKMVEGFRLAATSDTEENVWLLPDQRKARILSKNKRKKINYAFKLFIKYIYYLWY